MDMGRILSIFNGMKNVNMSGTPASEVVIPEGKRIALAPKDLLASHKAEVSRVATEYTPRFGDVLNIEQQYDEMADSCTTKIFYSGTEVTVNTQRYGNDFGHNVFSMTKKEDNMMECHNCNGLGNIDLGWGETVPCRECRASGKIMENDRTVAYGGAEDEGPMGKYGAGQMWQKDEMDFPPESFFKTDIAGEKKRGESANDHNLTVDDQLEQQGLEEAVELDEARELCSRCGTETTAPGLRLCDDCYKSAIEHAMDRANGSRYKRRESDKVSESLTDRDISMKRSQMEHEIVWCQNAIKKLEELLVKRPSKIKEINTLKRQIREKELKLAFDPMYGAEMRELPAERQMIDRLEETENIPSFGDLRNLINKLDKINEVAPTDKENWVKKNKKRFRNEYGKKKGDSVLYATAWKQHNKEK
jgi:hypothetical protein